MGMRWVPWHDASHGGAQAWVFKALDDGDPGLPWLFPRCYALAVAYGLPWVLHDLRLDGFTGLMLVLGAIHVQVLLCAATGGNEETAPCLHDSAWSAWALLSC